MKIKILYTFYTDGDYELRTPKNFGVTGMAIEINGDYFDYVGTLDFEEAEVWRCKNNAKEFLQKLLCDGIHVSYTHYWLMESFYDIITKLMHFIDRNDYGVRCGELCGNQTGTKIVVEFME